jgi:hypothetical protein
MCCCLEFWTCTSYLNLPLSSLLPVFFLITCTHVCRQRAAIAATMTLWLPVAPRLKGWLSFAALFWDDCGALESRHSCPLDERYWWTILCTLLIFGAEDVHVPNIALSFLCDIHRANTDEVALGSVFACANHHIPHALLWLSFFRMRLSTRSLAAVATNLCVGSEFACAMHYCPHSFAQVLFSTTHRCPRPSF